MTDFIWITDSDAVAYHDMQIAAHGGLPGIRDAGLLSSALSRPMMKAQFGEEDLGALAAAYAFGIARNHPFLDGNGRIGRLMITLYLVDKQLLTKPTLYLSDFFERNRGAYYDALTTVRTSHDIEHWIKFFLTGVSETAANSKQTFEKIVELRRQCEEKILQLGKRAPRGLALLRHLYSQPVMSANQIAARLGITHQSASSLIRTFEKMEILRETTGRKKDRLFIFSEYLRLFGTLTPRNRARKSNKVR